MRTNLAAIVCISCVLVGGCARKNKPNVLGLIPEDAAVVVWLPEPKAAVAALNGFLQTFADDSLGEQISALRKDVGKQLGFDPLDVSALEGFGLDPTQPWAAATERGAGSPLAGDPATPARRLAGDPEPGTFAAVFFFATQEPGKVLERFSKLMVDTLVIDKPTVIGSGQKKIYVFSQPFGSVMLEAYAMRLCDKAVMVTVGDGGSARLQRWPEPDTFIGDTMSGKAGDLRSFQKFWKRAESDGSLPGAAARIFARDAHALLPPTLADALGPEAQLRSALTIEPHKTELFSTVLGVKPERIAGLLAAPSGAALGAGFSETAVMFGRSQLAASRLHHLLRELTLFQPVLGAFDAQLGKNALEELVSLGSGEGAIAIEVEPAALKTTKATTTHDKLRALLDVFPISATAKLKDGAKFDAALGDLEKTLKAKGYGAALSTKNGQMTLRASTLSQRSEATLSRRGDTLVYAVGPGAFERLNARLDKGEGLGKADEFQPLLEGDTSGVIVDLHALVLGSSALPELLFGAQGSAQGVVARTFLGRTFKSFARFGTLGLTLQFEGRPLEPHPVLRLWLTTQ